MGKRRRGHKKVAEEEEGPEIIYSPGARLPNGIIFEQIGEHYIVFDQNEGTIVLPSDPEKQWTQWSYNRDKIYMPIDPLPWPTAPPAILKYESPEALWKETWDFLHEHLDLDDDRQYDVLVGTIFESYRIEDLRFTGYPFFIGPPASGKTRALELLWLLCYRGMLQATMSASALFRSISAWHPMIAMDEVQSYLAEKRGEFLALICAGQRKGQYAARVEKVGEGKLRLELHDVFCIKAMASTRPSTDTIMSRSRKIWMSKNIRPVPLFVDEEKAKELRGKFLMYRFKNVGQPLIGFTDIDFSGFRDGRVVELYYNLACLAPTPQIRERIIDYAREIEEETLAQEKFGFYAQVFKAFMRAVEYDMDHGKVPVGKVCDYFNEDLSEKEKSSARQMGKWLNALGIDIDTRMPDGKRARKYVPRKIKRLAKRYIPDQLSTYFPDITDITDIKDKGVSQKESVKETIPPLTITSETSETVKGSCALCGKFTEIKPMWHGDIVKGVCKKCAEEHVVRPVDFNIIGIPDLLRVLEALHNG